MRAASCLWLLLVLASTAAADSREGRIGETFGPGPNPGQHRIEYLAALAEKVKRYLRGVPKSGTTFTTVLVHNAMRAVAEDVYYGAADSWSGTNFLPTICWPAGPRLMRRLRST